MIWRVVPSNNYLVWIILTDFQILREKSIYTTCLAVNSSVTFVWWPQQPYLYIVFWAHFGHVNSWSNSLVHLVLSLQFWSLSLNHHSSSFNHHKKLILKPRNSWISPEIHESSSSSFLLIYFLFYITLYIIYFFKKKYCLIYNGKTSEYIFRCIKIKSVNIKPVRVPVWSRSSSNNFDICIKLDVVVLSCVVFKFTV